MSRCHACGKEGCPSQADPPTGPFTLHNAAAYAALLERRAVTHTHDPLEWCPDIRCLPGRLRAEAEVARTSNRGQHPAIKVMTHAAALRHAADIVEQSLPLEQETQ